jgi:hypothetical protein
MGKPSGMLHLRKGNNEITLYIRTGKIINSSSIERRRRLGDLLVHRGLLKRSELTQLLNLQRTVESDKRLGQILTERDIVSEETIRDILRLQLEEEIWNLFSWEEGEFHFETIEDGRLGDAIVSIDIEPLILEGTRRNDEWIKIEQIIPHDGVVLSASPLPEGFERTLNLRDQEWQVLSQINGHFTIRAIVNRSNLGRFEVHRILSNFIKSGLLTVKQSAAPVDINDEEFISGSNGAAGKAEAKGGGGLLGGLFGGKKEKAAVAVQMEFLSPIGMVAGFTTRMVERIAGLKEYTPSADDEKLLEIIWTDLVQTYTKADLVRVRGNRISTKVLERSFEACEFKELVDDCYEDAIEGLMNLLQTAFRVFATRVGERAASRTVKELLDEMGGRASVKYRGPFSLQERVQALLKLNA